MLYSLSTSDRMAAQWAFAFTDQNIARSAIRQTPCAADFLTNAAPASRGLPVRPENIVVPAFWQSAQTAAMASAAAGALSAASGQQKAVAATTESIQADLAPRPSGLDNWSVPEHGAYKGQAAGAAPVPVGVFERRDPQSAGDRYSGELGFASANAVIISGYGEYRFGTNGYATQLAAALNRGPVRRYLGNVTNGMLNGSGRLEWADNSFFEGEFSGDRPWRGMMTLPDGTVHYGTFNDGRLNGPGVELRAGTARWGNWSNGALPVPNPPA